MSKATEDREKRLKDTEEFYYANNCSIREATCQFNLKNHKTLSNCINNKHKSITQLGSKNKILFPEQEAVILAYGQSQAYASWLCNQELV
jgi:hypothetical protein